MVASTLRSIIAKELKHQSAYEFGVPRVIAYDTTLKGVYAALGNSLKVQAKEIKDGKIVSPFYDPDKNRIIGSIEGKIVELSALDFNKMILHHTAPENIDLIMNYVEKFYDQALNEEDLSKVQEIAGLMFWWICQAKRWRRGDPSIAEIIIRSIFAYKNIPCLPWKIGVVPWEEATNEFDPTAFSKNFHTLFDNQLY